MRSLAEHIKAKGPWKSVVFAGDILDLNFSTFTISIEGKGKGKRAIVGLRQFLSNLCGSNGNETVVENWIYIPGNHDYNIWNLLSTKRACMDVLATGKKMGSKPTPIKEGIWDGGSAFIAGVFPSDIRNRVTVKYPDHVIRYSRGRVVITHGHYLDPKQTLFKRLDKLIKETGTVNKAVRKMFIETAQYQAMANSLSYTPEMRKFINYLFGPRNLAKKIRGTIARYVDDASKIMPFSPIRNEPIDEGQLRAIEFYLKYFRSYRSAPDYFVFGHTHEQGKSSTSLIPKNKRIYQKKDIQVYNSGAFLPKRNKAATFLEIVIPVKGRPKVTQVYIDKKGRIVE
jgi:predicted phosphodiesterase